MNDEAFTAQFKSGFSEPISTSVSTQRELRSNGDDMRQFLFEHFPIYRI